MSVQKHANKIHVRLPSQLFFHCDRKIHNVFYTFADGFDYAAEYMIWRFEPFSWKAAQYNLARYFPSLLETCLVS